MIQDERYRFKERLYAARASFAFLGATDAYVAARTRWCSRIPSVGDCAERLLATGMSLHSHVAKFSLAGLHRCHPLCASY